ncbi:MAG: hypothetical protein HYU88_04315 [Chloroflexi bacterium]|nr:hypothetical protein [Chloroflexota bacterium]
METRRNVFGRALALTGALVLGQALRPRAAAAAGPRMILAKAMPQVPLEPQAPAWQQAEPVDIELSPQVVVKPRIYEVTATHVLVRALYDAERLALLLEWSDARRDVGMARGQTFRDAAAVQFPADPTRPLPHFAMGEPGNAVVIYQWKADWELGPAHDVNEEYPGMVVDFYPYAGKAPGAMAEASDYTGPASPPWPAVGAYNPAWWAKNPLADGELKRKTSVEKLTAAGFGSLTHQPPEEQDGVGKAAHTGDRWQVVIAVPRRQAAFALGPGDGLPVNFALWDGANRERGGEKAVGSWSFLGLERALDAPALALPPLVTAAVGGALWALVRRMQVAERRTPQP